MKLSTKSEYGLRAMLNIAMNGSGATTSVTDISKEEGISVAYLEQILNKLRRQGLLDSVRGSKGGYVLLRRWDAITVGDIVKTLDGPLQPAHCVGTKDGSRAACKKSKGCVPKLVWLKLAKAVRECLESITLKDLCAEAKSISRKS